MAIKKKLKKFLWSTKKQQIVTSVFLGFITLVVIGGCLYTFKTDKPVYQKQEDKIYNNIKKTHDESDLKGLVTGISDRYIVQNATGINYFYNIQCNSEIIKYINVDDSKVDLATPGSYQIKYTIGAKTKKLAEYLKESSTANEDEVEEIVVNKKINVITLEEAITLADAGNFVYSDNNQLVSKSDGTVTDVSEETIENATSPESLEDDETENERSTNQRPSNSNDQQSDNNSNTHHHSWQEITEIRHVEATGHYEEVEVAICNECGYENGHSENCSQNAGYTINIRPIWVQDSEAYDEVVVVGYRCSGCGAVSDITY